MSTPLEHRILRAVRRGGLVAPGARVAAAVSSGADSVALLLLLAGLRQELGVGLRVVHFHHGLRGADADADEAFVRELSARMGIECMVERADVRGISAREGWNLEDGARRLRLQFFARVVEQGLADCVATAHTADDQAETVLMRLLRGSGPSGLAGIHPMPGILLRPLLAVRRSELRAYLKERGQSWREDATNQDTSRLRARIRHQLLPLLEAEYQPLAVERLATLAHLAQRDDGLWRELTDACFDRLVTQQHGECAIAAQDLLRPENLVLAHSLREPASAEAISARLVRKLVASVSGRRGLSALHVEHVLEMARAETPAGHLELPGATAEKRSGRLIFRSADFRTPPPLAAYQYPVELPRRPGVETAVGHNGHRVRVKLFDCIEQGSETTIQANGLDFERLRAPMTLRNWRPGDAYRPRGRKGCHKLKRLFYESRIPAGERRSWPVLVCGDAIVWTRHFGVAHDVAVTEGTRRVLLVTEDRS